MSKPAARNLRSLDSTLRLRPVVPDFPPDPATSAFAPEPLWCQAKVLAPGEKVGRASVGGGRVPGWRRLTTQDIVDAALADWRKLAQRLHARFRAGDPGVGAALVSDAVRAAAEASLGDHLEATLTPTHVDLRVATHGDGIWVTADDVALARLLSDVARRHEVSSVPGEVTQVELAPRHRRRRPARPVLGGGAHR